MAFYPVFWILIYTSHYRWDMGITRRPNVTVSPRKAAMTFPRRSPPPILRRSVTRNPRRDATKCLSRSLYCQMHTGSREKKVQNTSAHMCAYRWVHMCSQTCMCAHMCSQSHMCTCMCSQTILCTCMCACLCSQTCMCARPCSQTHKCACKCSKTYICACARKYGVHGVG